MNVQSSIGDYDADTRTVSVTFTTDGKEPFTRPVNACHAADGSYDATATAARVAAVALGVETKFAIGIVGNPEPESVSAPGAVASEAEEPAQD